MHNLQKPPESPKDQMVENKTPKENFTQSNKIKQALLTQNIKMEFEAIGTPIPDPSVTQNHSSHVSEPEEHDAIDQQH